MKLNIPYYSQFLDVPDPFWMLRACGAVSLKMTAEALGVTGIDVLSLCEEAKEREGYHMENGWIHDYLVTKGMEFGLVASRKENIVDLGEIEKVLEKGEPVIVSVEKRVLEQKRFHMIVLTGFEVGAYGELISFYYHEPESTSREKGSHRSCTRGQFMDYFRGKAIFFSKAV